VFAAVVPLLVIEARSINRERIRDGVRTDGTAVQAD
jgi:hypothetical protein